MLVEMRRAEFDSLADGALGWACIEPTIRQIRGRNPRVKSEMYAQLTEGQRMLLAFQVLRGHSQNGVAQLFRELDHLLAYLDIWSALKRGMRHLGDREMVRVVEDMEMTYRTLPPTDPTAPSPWPASGDAGDELEAAFARLDTALRLAMPVTVARIGCYIREHSAEFARLLD